MALSIETTDIPGMLVLRLPVHEDARGWFKETWQREKMIALGLPDFGPVQNNVSYNARRGVTRGLHAEPWDKLVSVASGRAFGAWVDLRRSTTFGATYTLEIDPSVAVFVPRGVANAYQTLEDATAYTYLVNDHWRPDATYVGLDLGDPTAAIAWPIPLDQAEVSDKDRANPRLAEIESVPPRRTIILGSNGQLGRALVAAFPDAATVGHTGLDVGDEAALDAWPWSEYDLVINAAAYTKVDEAETPDGRIAAWAANAAAPAALARLARQHRFTLVHYSSDYVFDGTREEHPEDEPLSPLGVYGQTKAAGDLAVLSSPAHYLIRTAWVVGDGPNFVRTMQRLAATDETPRVVDDQAGRLTFADELARATRHLLDTWAPFGVYNVTNGGPVTTWADVARQVFELSGRSADDVTPVSSDEYAAGKQLAPRPRHSALDLTKVRATGYEPESALTALERYCSVAQRP